MSRWEVSLDEVDIKILSILRENARTPNTWNGDVLPFEGRCMWYWGCVEI